MAYQWNWVRGQDLTVKMNMNTTAATDTFVPVGLTDNLMWEPLNDGSAIFGVLKNKAAASALATDDDPPLVIVSEDIFECRCTGDLTIGQTVTCLLDNSVADYVSGELSCGVVVDYDPQSSYGSGSTSTPALCHIKAHFTSNNHTGTLA